MARCLLALGSNLGDRQAILRRACQAVAELTDAQLLARSQWHATTPVGGPESQGAFLNGALLLETSLKPATLADALHEIEARLGRTRMVRWDARPIDIDLLLYDRLVIDEPQLTIPHPRMSFRRFVLEPAAEIAGSMWHPTARWTVARLGRHLKASPRSALVTAADGTVASWLATRICESLGAVEVETDLAAGPCLAGGVQFAASGFVVRQLRFNASATGVGISGNRATRRPAFVIAANPRDPAQLRAAIPRETTMQPGSPEKFPPKKFRDFLEQNCDGPLARIESEDPAIVVAEAVAAVCSVWPDLTVRKAR